MWTSDLAKKAGPPLSHLGRRERGKRPNLDHRSRSCPCTAALFTSVLSLSFLPATNALQNQGGRTHSDPLQPGKRGQNKSSKHTDSSPPKKLLKVPHLNTAPHLCGLLGLRSEPFNNSYSLAPVTLGRPSSRTVTIRHGLSCLSCA